MPRCILSLEPRMRAWCLPHPHGSTLWRGGEEAGAAAAGQLPKLPLSVSFFSLFLFENFLLLNPATPYKEGPVLSYSPPLQLDLGTVWVRALHGPTLDSPQLVPTVSVGLPLRPIPLRSTSSNQVSLCAAQALFSRGGTR